MVMDRQQLEDWLAEGLSLDEIGRRVGRHPSTVAYWVQKHGLQAANKSRHAARGGIPREALAELIARALTTRQIAGELDCSQATVRYWLDRHGLRVLRARGVRGAQESNLSTVDGDCPRHGPITFVRRRDGAWRCVQCRIDAVTERRRRVKAVLVEEAGGSCSICGYDRYIGALQFHHLDPSEKAFDLGRVGVSRSIERARDEARKCILLCSNCHAEVEGGVAVLPS